MIVTARGPGEALVVETAKRELCLCYLGTKGDAKKAPFWSLTMSASCLVFLDWLVWTRLLLELPWLPTHIHITALKMSI